MKKANLLMILLAIVFSMAFHQPAKAQDASKAKYVEAFDEGRVLNSTDIKFLNSISDGRGDRDAVVNGRKYSVGQRLTSNEAALLNLAKSKYRKAHPMEKATDAKAINKTRGSQETCYWYLYCDGNGTCYYIWYCD